MTWRQVDVSVHPRRGSATHAWALAVLPAVVQVLRSRWPAPLVVALVLLSLPAAVPAAWRHRGGLAALAVAGMLELLLLRASGLVLSASLAIWVLLLAVPVALPVEPDWSRRARPAIGPMVLATVLPLLRPGLMASAALVAAAGGLAVAGIALPRLSGAVVGFAERLGTGLGRVLGVVVMLPVVVLVMLQSLAQHLVRYDPLAAPAERTSRWVVRQGADPNVDRAFSRVPVVDPRRGIVARRAASKVVFGVLVVMSLVWGTLAVLRPYDRAPRDVLGNAVSVMTVGNNAAMLAEPDWPTLMTEITAFTSRGQFDPVTVFRFPDARGALVNVVDRSRRTWRAPACGCRRLSVWWFGGSAAWGMYQPDEHTIPSQLARLAWQDGIALDIENYAAPAYLIGQEVRLFGELSTRRPAPDLVLFYDGGNDVIKQMERNARGEGADESELVQLDVADALNGLLRNDVAAAGQAIARIGDPVRSERDSPPLSNEEVARHAVSRYLRSVDLAERTAASIGSRPVFLWQPMAMTSPRGASDRSVLPRSSDWDAWAELYRAATARLPDEVIDLSGALRNVHQPVFTDPYHTNSAGAAVVAEHLYDRLRPELEAASR